MAFEWCNRQFQWPFSPWLMGRLPPRWVQVSYNVHTCVTFKLLHGYMVVFEFVWNWFVRKYVVHQYNRTIACSISYQRKHSPDELTKAQKTWWETIRSLGLPTLSKSSESSWSWHCRVESHTPPLRVPEAAREWMSICSTWSIFVLQYSGYSGGLLPGTR